MNRGPYRKPSKLTVKEKTWQRGDVVQTGRSRWIIRTLTQERVILHLSNNPNTKKAVWTTTLDRLPAKASQK